MTPNPRRDRAEASSLSSAQLPAFLTAMRTHDPPRDALVMLLAYTGLRSLLRLVATDRLGDDVVRLTYAAA